MDLIVLLIVAFVIFMPISIMHDKKKESGSRGPLNQRIIDEMIGVIAVLRVLIAKAQRGGSIYILDKKDSIYISANIIDELSAWYLEKPDDQFIQTLTRAEGFKQQMDSALQEAQKSSVYLSDITSFQELGIDYSLKDGFEDWVFFEKWVDTPGSSARYCAELYSILAQAYPDKVRKDQYGGINL